MQQPSWRLWRYDIVRIDTFEGYKEDLKLYCKRKDK